MRTTLDLDPGVHRELKRRAKDQGKSLGRVASEALSLTFGQTETAAMPPLTWISRPMGALVDLEDKEAVRRVLDAG